VGNQETPHNTKHLPLFSRGGLGASWCFCFVFFSLGDYYIRRVRAEHASAPLRSVFGFVFGLCVWRGFIYSKGAREPQGTTPEGRGGREVRLIGDR
jgi:hypothetical protein